MSNDLRKGRMPTVAQMAAYAMRTMKAEIYANAYYLVKDGIAHVTGRFFPPNMQHLQRGIKHAQQ